MSTVYHLIFSGKNLPQQMSRKTVSDMFYTAELENEIRHKAFLGCGTCYSIDGNWKLCFPHCMFPVKAGLPGLPNLNFPDVCIEQLNPGLAFCKQ